MTPNVFASGVVSQGKSLAAEGAMPLSLAGNPMIDHPKLWLRAFHEEGVTEQKRIAYLMGMTVPQASQAFSWNYPNKNAAMKRLSLMPDDRRSADEQAIVLRVTCRYHNLLGQQLGHPSDGKLYRLAVAVRGLVNEVLGGQR